MGLIDANMYCMELYNEMNCPGRSEEFMAAIDVAIADLARTPTVDAVPVRHGRWERTADGAALCTACKRKMSPSQYGYAFCGLCGAKMDGEL